MAVTIRAEAKSDRRSIWALTKDAFAGKPYADGDEQDLIDALRGAGVLSVSLVAVEGGKLIGQITFSPATISSGVGSWYALGPVSVAPGRQGEGVGGQLIEAGISEIRALGAWGCILVGDPEYYSRHGFGLAPANCPDRESREHFMIRTLRGRNPEGRFSFHPSFYTGA